jgi:hypothetical protein
MADKTLYETGDGKEVICYDRTRPNGHKQMVVAEVKFSEDKGAYEAGDILGHIYSSKNCPEWSVWLFPYVDEVYPSKAEAKKILFWRMGIERKK